MTMRNIAALALGTLAVAGCYPKTAAAPAAVAPTELSIAKAKFPDVTDDELKLGHDRFIEKCNGCHGYPDLHAIAADKWPSIVERMGKKADLDARSTQAVLRFVVTAQAH
jgi:hypothetical protein